MPPKLIRGGINSWKHESGACSLFLLLQNLSSNTCLLSSVFCQFKLNVPRESLLPLLIQLALSTSQLHVQFALWQFPTVGWLLCEVFLEVNLVKTDGFFTTEPPGKPGASRILSLFKGQLASNLSSICYSIPLCHATYQIYRFQGLGCGNLRGGSLFSPPYTHTHTHTHTQRNSKDIYHIINSRWLSCGILFFIFLLFRFSVVNTNTKCLINAFIFYCKTKLYFTTHLLEFF